MKKHLLIFLCFSALADHAFAQGGAQADMVKRRAKALEQQNNVNQGIVPPPGAAPAATPQPAAPPPARGIDPNQQLMIDKLQADLGLVKAGSPVTADQKLQLQNDASVLAKGVVHPSKDLLAKLAEDISAALAEKTAALKDDAQLAKDINVVVNSVNLAPAQVQNFVSAAQNVLKTGGVSDPAVETVVNELKAIVADLQKNKPKLY